VRWTSQLVAFSREGDIFQVPKMIVFAYDNKPSGINICDIMEETGQVAVVRWNN